MDTATHRQPSDRGDGRTWDPERSPRVAFVGLHVLGSKAPEGWRVDRGSWEMLSFFSSHLDGPIYSLADVSFEGRDGFDMSASPALDLRALNRAPYRGLSRWRQWRHISRHYEQLAQEVDFFFLRLPAFQALAAWRVAQKRGIPYFVSLHGHWDRVFRHAPRSSLVRRLFNALMARYVHHMTRKIFRGARHVFFVGSDLTSRFQDDVASCSTIAHFMHAAQEVAEGLSAPPQAAPLRVLFVGQLIRQKGIYVLLEALEGLVREGLDVVVELAGRGPEEKALQRSAREGPLAGRITLLGWLSPGEELDEAFGRASVFCLPSYSEGVPKVVMEALVRGVPTAASAVGDVNELLGGGERGWPVPAGDARALQGALKEALTDDVERSERASAGLLYARAHTRDAQVSRIREALETIAPALVTSTQPDPAGRVKRGMAP